jgi:hypothetical protein
MSLMGRLRSVVVRSSQMAAQRLTEEVELVGRQRKLERGTPDPSPQGWGEPIAFGSVGVRFGDAAGVRLVLSIRCLCIGAVSTSAAFGAVARAFRGTVGRAERRGKGKIAQEVRLLLVVERGIELLQRRLDRGEEVRKPALDLSDIVRRPNTVITGRSS